MPHPSYEIERGDGTECMCGRAPAADEQRVVFSWDPQHFQCLDCATECIGCCGRVSLDVHQLCASCRAEGTWEWSEAADGTPGWFRTDEYIDAHTEARAEQQWAQGLAKALGMGVRKTEVA